jgi:hypothetical protein
MVETKRLQEDIRLTREENKILKNMKLDHQVTSSSSLLPPDLDLFNDDACNGNKTSPSTETCSSTLSTPLTHNSLVQSAELNKKIINAASSIVPSSQSKVKASNIHFNKRRYQIETKIGFKFISTSMLRFYALNGHLIVQLYMLMAMQLLYASNESYCGLNPNRSSFGDTSNINFGGNIPSAFRSKELAVLRRSGKSELTRMNHKSISMTSLQWSAIMEMSGYFRYGQETTAKTSTFVPKRILSCRPSLVKATPVKLHRSSQIAIKSLMKYLMKCYSEAVLKSQHQASGKN